MKIDQLHFSRRKSIALQITRDGKLVVRAPNRISQKIIHQFIISKQHWITKKIQQALERQSKVVPKNYLPGEKFLYLGESYPLEVIDHQTTPVVFANSFLLAKQYEQQIKTKLFAWYRQQAEKIIFNLLADCAAKHKFKYNSVKLSNAKTKWGSCNSKGHLMFNWRLVMAPLSVIEYVVIHELSHLIHPNHSKKFWQHVQNLLPDYQEQRKWLKENAAGINS